MAFSSYKEQHNHLTLAIFREVFLATTVRRGAAEYIFSDISVILELIATSADYGILTGVL